MLEEKTLEDQSALYEGPVKLASAKAKQVLPEYQTTRNSYDVDPNLDFKMRIERAHARVQNAHKTDSETKYEFQEYPKAVSKQDKDGKLISATVDSKEAEDHFHGNADLVGVDEKSSARHDIHGNEVVRLVPTGVEPEIVKPIAPLYYHETAKEDKSKPPADYTAEELKNMAPGEVPDYTVLHSSEMPDAIKPKE